VITARPVRGVGEAAVAPPEHVLVLCRGDVARGGAESVGWSNLLSFVCCAQFSAMDCRDVLFRAWSPWDSAAESVLGGWGRSQGVRDDFGSLSRRPARGCLELVRRTACAEGRVPGDLRGSCSAYQAGANPAKIARRIMTPRDRLRPGGAWTGPRVGSTDSRRGGRRASSSRT
jgi:hypothetical protein